MATLLPTPLVEKYAQSLPKGYVLPYALSFITAEQAKSISIS
jgi:hypothetical protein